MTVIQVNIEFNHGDAGFKILNKENEYDDPVYAFAELSLLRAVTDYILFTVKSENVEITLDFDKTKAIFLRNILNAFIETQSRPE